MMKRKIFICVFLLASLGFAQDSLDCEKVFQTQKTLTRTNVRTFPVVHFSLEGNFSEGCEAIIFKLDDKDLLVEVGFGYAMGMERYYFSISEGMMHTVSFEYYEFNAPPISDSTAHIINRRYQCWRPGYRVDLHPLEYPAYPVSTFYYVLEVIREQHGEEDWKNVIRYLGMK